MLSFVACQLIVIAYGSLALRSDLLPICYYSNLCVIGSEGALRSIPDICHERHEYIRVKNFWPV